MSIDQSAIVFRSKISSFCDMKLAPLTDARQFRALSEYMTRLIVDICGGEVGPLDDQVIALPERKPVRMRLDRCRRVLGLALERAEVEDIFTRLSLPFTVENDVFIVEPPSYRFDLVIEEDLIEEVARIYGFERIPDLPPRARAHMRALPETLRGPHELRVRMAALDYQEVINFSFVEEAWERDYAGNDNPIRLLNPIASQLAVMRSSLIGGLVANIAYNMRHRQSRVRVFELGRVFMRNADVRDGDLSVAGVEQPTRLAAAAWGPALEEQWGEPVRQVDFYDVKSDLVDLLGTNAARMRCVPAVHPALHPGRSARIEIDGKPAGWLGELHPRWVQKAELGQAPVVFEIDVAAISEGAMPALESLSRQPVVIRDLAVWVDNAVSYQDLLDTLTRTVASDANLNIVREIRLFDVWRDKSAANEEKSLAFRFRLQNPEATLDDDAVDACMVALLQALKIHHGARQRA